MTEISAKLVATQISDTTQSLSNIPPPTEYKFMNMTFFRLKDPPW